MPILFADIDWFSVAAAGLTAVFASLAALGGTLKLLLDYLKRRDVEYRAAIRKLVRSVMVIQKRTIKAVDGLGRQVQGLGQAIDELRAEMATKMDRPTGDKP